MWHLDQVVIWSTRLPSDQSFWDSDIPGWYWWPMACDLYGESQFIQILTLEYHFSTYLNYQVVQNALADFDTSTHITITSSFERQLKNMPSVFPGQVVYR